MIDPTRAAGAAPLRQTRRQIPGLLWGLVLLVIAGFGPVLPPAQGQPADGFVLERPFPYSAKDETLLTMLHAMTQKTRVPVIPAEGVSGRGNLDNSGGSLRDALDQLTQGGLGLWWFDGAAVHVEPPTALTSRLISLRGVPLPMLKHQLRVLGLEDDRWPLIGGGDARMARLVAPQGYAEAVEAVIASLTERPGARGEDTLPVIIRGPGRLRGAEPVMTPTMTQPAARHAVPPAPAAPQSRKDIP